MHELPVIKKILDIVLKHSKEHDLEKIEKIYLDVGELSDLQDKWMQHYFDYISESTMAKGAKLEIKRIPVKMRCRACGHIYSPDIRSNSKIVCSVCDGSESIIISGKEYRVSHLEAC